jgi:hypothetical protein
MELPCFLSQYQERSLEGILSILSMTQRPLAHSLHQPSVPLHQLSKGRFALVQDKIPQEFGIGAALGLLLEDLPERSHGHHLATSTAWLEGKWSRKV